MLGGTTRTIASIASSVNRIVVEGHTVHDNQGIGRARNGVGTPNLYGRTRARITIRAGYAHTGRFSCQAIDHPGFTRLHHSFGIYAGSRRAQFVTVFFEAQGIYHDFSQLLHIFNQGDIKLGLIVDGYGFFPVSYRAEHQGFSICRDAQPKATLNVGGCSGGRSFHDDGNTGECFPALIAYCATHGALLRPEW